MSEIVSAMELRQVNVRRRARGGGARAATLERPARALSPAVQPQGGKEAESGKQVSWERRLQRARRLGPQVVWPSPSPSPSPQGRRGVVRRELLAATTFDTREEIERDQEISGYLRIYLDIANLVRSYNEGLTDADLLLRLNTLDGIEDRVRACRSALAKEANFSERPVFRRIVHLHDLVETVRRERAELLAQTERKEILAGPQATLPSGVTWDFWNEGREEWRDASALLREGESLPVTIVDEVDGKWIFTFVIRDDRERGRTDVGALTPATKFTGDDSALYPHGIPKPEDVRQTNLGDCYLQAALAALAAQNPSYIMNKMIYDAGDRGVVVRLHKLPDKEPHFINVERSKAQTTGGVDLYSAGALWVKMVQKAYAASGFASTILRERKNLSIQDISGDMVGYLMGVLTGGDLESFSPGGEEMQETIVEKMVLPWGFEVETFAMYRGFGKMPTSQEDREEYQAALTLLERIFEGDMDSVGAWTEFAEEHRDELEELKTLRGFSRFFVDNLLDVEVAERIMAWVESSGLVRGEIGSGKYSKGQLMAFDRIEEALTLRRLVAIGTRKELTEGPGEGTGAAGEQKYKGLAGGHAYSVLDCRRNGTSDPTSSTEGEIFWVQLRNPWGEYSRTYDEQWNPVAIEEGDGVFWVELTDLVRNFTDIEII